MAGAARQALTQDSSPTPLAERLGTRIRHILVDEFQDTSRDQYDLLRTLTQDWSAATDRTLFLVGDPMQSIYGFRNAEVGRFSTVRAAGLVRSDCSRWNCGAISVPRRRWCTGATKSSRACSPDVGRRAARAPCGTWPASPRARTWKANITCIASMGDCGPRRRPKRRPNLIAELKRTRPAETIACWPARAPTCARFASALGARGVPFIGVNLEPLADVPVVRDLRRWRARWSRRSTAWPGWRCCVRRSSDCPSRDLTVISRGGARFDRPAALRGDIFGLSPDGMERLLRAKALLLAGWRQRELRTPRPPGRAYLARARRPPAPARRSELATRRRFLLALDEEDRKRLRGRPLDLERS